MSPENPKENTVPMHTAQRIHLSSSVFAWTLGSFFMSSLAVSLGSVIDGFVIGHTGFGADKDHELSATVGSLSEATAVSRDIWTFCTERNLPPDKAYRASLVAEELASNVIRYGFSDGKSHRLELRLIIIGDDLILRLRDNCRRFDPKEYYEQLFAGETEAASMENIGLRMVMRSAREVSYTSVLRLNNMIIRI